MLNNLLLMADDGMLSVVGNNLEMEATAQVEVETARPGQATVHAHKLFEALREVDDETVTIEHNDGFVSVRSQSARFRFVSQPAENYPRLEREQPKAAFEVEGETLS
ncbi:MAG: hypothetical protein D6771_05390, partial [Zetaproteobacteria bacterium]